MTTEKLPNGHYRVRQYTNGKRYSVTFNHKPTQKEILTALAEKMDQIEPDLTIKGSVEDYALKLIDLKRKQGKSTTTLNSYNSIVKNTPEKFLTAHLGAIKDKDCKELVREYSSNHSAKSTRNLWSFYHSVIREYRPEYTPHVELPTVEKTVEYEPSTKDIQRVIEESVGSAYELPLKLAMLGLRRGEICALTVDDLDHDNILVINKDMVLDEHNKYIIKPSPKTAASNRRILIPTAIADLIREKGYIFQGNPHTINEALHRYQDKLGIPRFRLHLLRHFAAAYLHQQGFTDAQILAYGGWENGSDVMQRVYRYNLDPEKSQTDIVNKFNDLI